MAIVTVYRQAGSLGKEIMEKIAGTLGYKLLNKEIIEELLEKSGFLEQKGIKSFIEEKRPSFISGFLSRRANIVRYIRKILYEFAQNDNAIIFGMGSQIAFQDFPKTLHVRVIAAKDIRIQRIKEQKSCDESQAEYEVVESDEARSGFNKFFFKTDADSSDLYDLVINTSNLTLEGASSVIIEAIRDIENNEESKKFASTIKDQQLREDILIKVLNEEKLSVAGFDASVEGGVVTLYGIVIQEVDRNSSENIVRQIPGVKDVKNLIGVSK